MDLEKTKTISSQVPVRAGIQTKYLGPTQTKGSRIVAWDGWKRTVVPFQHELDHTDNHLYAALCFVEEHEFDSGIIAGGATADGKGYVFVRGNL